VNVISEDMNAISRERDGISKEMDSISRDMNGIPEEIKIQRFHGMTLLPLTIYLVLSIWHFISYYYYSDKIPGTNQIFLLILSFLMVIIALFLRGTRGEASRYIEGLFDHLRPHLIGISCLLIGGIHLFSILGDEPVYLQLAYVVLILAYFETAGLAINFYEHYSNEMIDVTRGTVQRLLVNSAGKLAMVFALSFVMLYLSLMVIVGFIGPFSVAFLAAVMILAIAFMTLVRRL